MGPKWAHDIKVTNEAPPETLTQQENNQEQDPSDIPTNPDSIPNRKNNKKRHISLQNPNWSTEMENEALNIKQKHNRQCEDQDLIEQCIVKHFFMRTLERQARWEITKEMSWAQVNPNTIICKQGTPGSYFYILKTGEACLIIDNDKKKTFSVGESFGELALLHGAPRSGTVIAVTECYLWVLERKNFRKIVDHITKMHFEENKTFIQSISILANMDHSQKTILCSSWYKESFEKGKVIVKEGEQAYCWFIIKEGEVDCMRNGKVIRTWKRGDNFGERSILVDSNRTMDVIAKTNCVCYSVSISTLKNMLSEKYRSLLYLNFIKNSFAISQNFQRFNPYLIDQIFDWFEAVNLGEESIAFPKGYRKSESIVVIIDGHLINSETKETVADRGAILFEEELLKESDEWTDFDLLPYPDCLLIKANTAAVIGKLGSNLKEIMQKSEILESLSKVNIFKNWTRKKLEVITQKIGIKKYEDGEKIISEGENGDKFYIVKSGKVDIQVDNKYLRTLNEKEYFGERALFFNEARSATAIAKGSIEVFYISQIDFMANIENNMKEHWMNRLYLQDDKLELEDLLFKDVLGSGNYGCVSLVTCHKNNYKYAIKGISRKQIDHEQLHPNLELERSIWLQIDHPFIVKLVKTWKDERFIYFLMEYIKGKELFDVIRDIGWLNKIQTQFYGGSMMLAIEYLHERKFIYRDLKPENIIISYNNGYLKWIDFGTAKIIIDRTSTIIGTPHYMAPEVILGKGYSFQVDLWSIAICWYEFMCGGVPFGENAEDPMEVYLAIVNNKIAFPPFCKDKEFKQLMIHMLCKNPLNRWTKVNQIKNHIWFQNFNWEELMTMNMQAYIPKPKKEETVQGVSKLSGMKFVEYVKDNYKEWEPKKKSTRVLTLQRGENTINGMRIIKHNLSFVV